ncbi:hypothetical protein [Mesoflavibacter zeaxanthinifaciens]|uniref:hypothetical protein n=1 Tax=Mesoflavibacter zeaxanthinifaciens TaxID=393060 RepID=UPI00041D684C|nr:hypothetical protein [Mesoflavibacter zeaxanthinifaciens]
MTIKERKRILYFLEALMVNLESHEDNHVSAEFLNLFSRKELMDMVLWLHTNYDKSMLAEKTDAELLELLNDDSNILAYVIEQWKANISAVPKLTQDDVFEFFERIPIYIHYLRDKPVEEWDDYDVSNYYSLLFKHGKTKRVFAIFTSDVKDEDKYAVTTQPSFFFDTKEEAQEELERICLESKRSKSDFTIHSLWKSN